MPLPPPEAQLRARSAHPAMHPALEEEELPGAEETARRIKRIDDGHDARVHWG